MKTITDIPLVKIKKKKLSQKQFEKLARKVRKIFEEEEEYLRRSRDNENPYS